MRAWRALAGAALLVLSGCTQAELAYDDDGDGACDGVDDDAVTGC